MAAFLFPFSLPARKLMLFSVTTLGFFTNRDVKAGEELTLNYHYSLGAHPGGPMFCECGQPSCVGRLMA